MNDGEALLAAILADRADGDVKLVYADWLDEHDEPLLAFTYRWMARNGKYPWLGIQMINTDGYKEGDLVWTWDSDKTTGALTMALHAQLPSWLWEKIDSDTTATGGWKKYHSWDDAIVALAAALPTHGSASASGLNLFSTMEDGA